MKIKKGFKSSESLVLQQIPGCETPISHAGLGVLENAGDCGIADINHVQLSQLWNLNTQAHMLPHSSDVDEDKNWMKTWPFELLRSASGRQSIRALSLQSEDELRNKIPSQSTRDLVATRVKVQYVHSFYIIIPYDDVLYRSRASDVECSDHCQNLVAIYQLRNVRTESRHYWGTSPYLAPQ